LKGTLVNKNDLVAHVADTTGLSRADATKAVDAIFEGITTSLKSGDEVRLVGFGTFLVSERAASDGRNPRTGEKIAIPASKQPKFKAGKVLKDAVNE
jgi:DNA-binding protein HU-beta